jgi:hypothetical protein
MPKGGYQRQALDAYHQGASRAGEQPDAADEARLSSEASQLIRVLDRLHERGSVDERVDRVIALLESFEPSKNESESLRSLYEIFTGFRGLANGERVIPAIFGVMERHPEAELGAPGPLVHEVEALPSYETLLRESLRRQPALLSIWMANRLANATDGSEREGWLAELRAVLDHANASASLKEEALAFLAYQAESEPA